MSIGISVISIAAEILYRAGVECAPCPASIQRRYDLWQVAIALGMFTKYNEPAEKAVIAIAEELEFLSEDMQRHLDNRDPFSSVRITFAEPQITEMKQWLISNHYPDEIICRHGEICKSVYKPQIDFSKINYSEYYDEED